MGKTINLLVNETQQELVELVNSKLAQGLPITVLNYIVTDILTNIRNECSMAIQIEKEELKKEQEKEEAKGGD